MYLKSPIHPFTSYLFVYLVAGWFDGCHFNPLGELNCYEPFLSTFLALHYTSCLAKVLEVLVVLLGVWNSVVFF